MDDSAAGDAALAPDGPTTLADFGAVLAGWRTRAELTQQELAHQLAFKRPRIAQWESGRNLPPDDAVRDLDAALRAGGELVGLAARVRDERVAERVRSSRPTAVGRRRGTLAVFRRVGTALADRLIWRTDAGPGWQHWLHLPAQTPTPLATAYGLKAVLVLRGAGVTTADHVLDPGGHTRQIPLASIEEWLRAVARRNEREYGAWGWAAGADFGGAVPTAEVTAGVLDALYRLNPARPDDERGVDVDRLQALMTRDDFAATRPTVLATVLEAAGRIAPEHPAVPRLVDMLLATRVRGGLWPERIGSGLVRPLPSVAHTARAVWALQTAADRRIGGEQDSFTPPVDEISRAADWLSAQSELHTVTELPDPEGGLLYPIRHFTAAWVARALVATGRFDLAGVASRTAVDEIWKAYDEQQHHLWFLRTGELPIWMTCDALETLRMLGLERMTVELGAPARDDST